jgi:hypothetical protein
MLKSALLIFQSVVLVFKSGYLLFECYFTTLQVFMCF